MYVCTISLIRNWSNLQEKGQIWIFHDLLGARQRGQKSSGKKTFIFDCYDLTIQFFYYRITYYMRGSSYSNDWNNVGVMENNVSYCYK